LTVNERVADVDTEKRQAAGFDLAAYKDITAVVKAALSSIFGQVYCNYCDKTSSFH